MNDMVYVVKAVVLLIAVLPISFACKGELSNKLWQHGKENFGNIWNLFRHYDGDGDMKLTESEVG